MYSNLVLSIMQVFICVITVSLTVLKDRTQRTVSLYVCSSSASPKSIRSSMSFLLLSTLVPGEQGLSSLRVPVDYESLA
jgi:hypothetical protein